MRPLDYAELLTAYATRHSEAAFTELVGRHVGLVYSAALRQTGNPHLAEEVTQAVFIILARKARAVSRHTALSGWLCRVAFYVSRDALRAERRRQHREQMATQMENTSDKDWTQLSPLLDEAVAQLREKDRSAIVLRFYEQKSLGEVGNVLGVDADAAQKRVSRALEKLRKIFTKRGIALSTAAIAGAVSANSVQAAPAGLAKAVSAVAAAKGVAAGGSTLTLVKGALKLMAWSKAQTVIVAGVVVLLAAGTTTVVVKRAGASDSLQIYEDIWRHPDSSSMDSLDKVPPVLIIRPARYPKLVSGVWTGSGKVVFDNALPIDMLGWAYGLGQPRMVLPEDMPGGSFDYLNTLPTGQNEALQEKLKEQFGLVAHRETRETDVLLLQVKDSMRLDAHRSQGGKTENYGTGDGNIQKRLMTNQKLGVLAGMVESLNEIPTLDETGASGSYDFSIQWVDDKGWSTERRIKKIQPVLGDKLDEMGLELVPARKPVEMLIVERVKN